MQRAADAGASADAASDAEWRAHIAASLSTRPLARYLAAFECITRPGGHDLLQPPCEQALLWRRLLCWRLASHRDLFGIPRPDGALPKCMLMCNLGGHMSFYYAESSALARVVCACTRSDGDGSVVEAGVDSVLRHADELGASVLVCMCKPFEVAAADAHCDLRTIRWRDGSALIDGERCFSWTDVDARAVPCTLSCTNASEQTLDALYHQLQQTVSPVCIEVSQRSTTSDMTPCQMAQAIEMLKADRKRLVHEHKEALHAAAAQTKEAEAQAASVVDNAVSKADVRISKIVACADAQQKAHASKQADLTARLADALSACAAQRAIVREAASDVEHTKATLQKQQQQAQMQEATLQAQIRALQVSNTRSIATASRAHNELRTSSNAELARQRSRIADLQREAAKLKAAGKAVQSSAAQCKRDADEQCRRLRGDATALRRRLRVCSATLALAAARHAALRHESSVVAANGLEQRAQLAALQKSLAESEWSQANAEQAAATAEAHAAEAQRSAARRACASVIEPPASAATGVWLNHNYDPWLETSISQLHAALNAVTKVARASAAHQRASAVAQAQLHEIAAHGLVYNGWYPASSGA